jgi:hypothetical protein
MVITHAAIIGTVTKLAGLYILLSAGIVFFRVVLLLGMAKYERRYAPHLFRKQVCVLLFEERD